VLNDMLAALGITDLVIKVFATLGAMAAFLVGLRQYKKGQAWQRSQIVLSLIQSFEGDEHIEAACAMLDWDEREVSLGEGQQIQFKNSLLPSALRVPAMDVVRATSHETADGKVTFTREESFIRDAFDALFDFFDKLYAFREMKLLTVQDCTYFRYWLELLRDIRTYKGSPEIHEAISRYMEAYHFKGVRKLLEEYSRNPEPLAIMDDADTGSLATPGDGREV
jgi:hypothetical protein